MFCVNVLGSTNFGTFSGRFQWKAVWSPLVTGVPGTGILWQLKRDIEQVQRRATRMSKRL